MLNFLFACIKYSAFGLVVLVLSNIIEIKGTTISRHVQIGMAWISGRNPIDQGVILSEQIAAELKKRQKDLKAMNQIGDNIGKTLKDINVRYPSAQSIDSEVSIEDQRELHNIIQRSNDRANQRAIRR